MLYSIRSFNKQDEEVLSIYIALRQEENEERKKQILEIFRVFVKEIPLPRRGKALMPLIFVGGEKRNRVLVVKQEILYKILPADGQSRYLSCRKT